MEYVKQRNGVTVESGNILHTGKKPSGSYTGNGSGTARIIDTGGSGLCCAIYNATGGNQFAILTPGGAITKNGTTITAMNRDAACFENGQIHLGTSDGAVNSAQYKYNYQVL